ncbi:hypothetical protein GCM10020000_61000 [Streptomyces olivoverticillatus]
MLYGQEDPVTSLLVDETPHTPHVTCTTADDHAAYTLTFTGGTRIDVEIRATGPRVDWKVTRIADTPALPVGTLRIPDLALLSVRSTQPGATLLAARIQLDAAKNGDTLLRVTPDTPRRGRTHRLRLRRRLHRRPRRRHRDEHRLRPADRGHRMGERTAVAADPHPPRLHQSPAHLRPVDTPGRHRPPYTTPNPCRAPPSSSPGTATATAEPTGRTPRSPCATS